VVGATGDIGSTCATALAGRVRRLILVGRNENKLHALADRLSGTAIETSEDAGAAAPAHVVITATSSAEPVLDDEALAPGTVVLDVGYPPSIRSTSGTSRVSIIHAGLATLPWDLGIDYLTGLEGKLMFGCYAEAITLALHRRRTGSGPGSVASRDLATVAAGFDITPALISLPPAGRGRS
jgi:predicted amino acid dehydrogenase